MSVSALSACSPKEDDADSKEETELSTAEPTIDAEEGELPFLSASDLEKSKSSSSVSSSKASGSDSVEGQPSPEGATVSSGSSGKSSDSSKPASGDTKKNADKSNKKTEPTLSPSADRYIEENGDELPFVPANRRRVYI